MKKKYIQYLVLIALICVAVYLIPEKIAILFNNKGVMAYNENDYARAISFYKKSISIYPMAQTYFNLGCVYEKTGDDAQAVLEFKRTIEKDPEHEGAYKALASIYAVRGDYKTAEDYLDKLESLGAEDTASIGQDIKKNQQVKLYNQGVRFYIMGDHKKALNAFLEVIKRDASNSLACKAAADIYANQGKLSQALAYYKKAVTLGLKDADAFNSMGIMCMRTEDYESGVKYFRKALEMDKGNLHYLYNLASTLRDSGQFQEAISLYKEVLDRSARYPNVHNDLAGIYRALEFEDKARSEYQKAYDIEAELIEKGAQDEFTFTRYAIACNGLNKTDEAEKILDNIIANNPKYYKAYYARAEVYKAQGKDAQSRADYSRARELAKNIVSPVDQAALQEQPREQPGPGRSKQKQPDISFFKEDSSIYLNNGHIVRGRIKKETDKKIAIEIKTGQTLSTITFQKSKIKKIEKIN